MGRVLGGVILAVLVGWWWWPDRVPAQALPVVADGTHAGERAIGGGCPQGRCVIVYLAPWCPACRQSEPMIRELRETLERDGIGVQVVAGMDRAPALETYGHHLGYPVFLDTGGRLQRDAGVRAVPAFVVLDRRGRVDATVTGAYPDVATMRRRLGV